GLRWPYAVALTALALGAGVAHFHARPHLVTIVLLAVTYCMLAAFEDGRLSLRGLFVLVGLCALWTNLHGGVLGGLGTLGLAVAVWGLLLLLGLGGPIPTWRQPVAIAVLAVLCGLTVLVNPYGLRVPQTWLAIMGSAVIPNLIMEHGATDLTTPYALLLLLL